MNSVIIHGRLARDPDVRYTNEQMAVANFTVAVDRDMTKAKREQAQAKGQPTADFIRCKAFGKTAEVIEKYLSKGRRILIQGRIQTGSYENKQGQTVYTTDVIVGKVEFTDYSQSQGQNNNGQQQYSNNGNNQYHQPQRQQNEYQTSMDDELPEGFQMIDEDEVPF